MPTGEERFLVASPRHVFAAENIIASSQATPTMGVSNLLKYEPDEPWRATDLSGLRLDIKLREPADWNLVALLYTSFATGDWGDFWRVSSAGSQAGLDSPLWTSGWQEALPVAYDPEIYPFIHSLLWLGAGNERSEPWVRIEYRVGERYLQFNGSTSEANGGDIFDLADGDAELTVRVRFRTTTSGGVLVGRKSTSAAGTPGWMLRLDGSNPSFLLADGSSLLKATSSFPFDTGQWFECWGRVDRTAQVLRLTVAGLPFTSNPISGLTAVSNSENLYLGRTGSGAERYTGDLDEIAVWTRSLSDSEIASREGKPLERGDADSYWHADEGAGSTAADQEDSNDLALTDVAWGSAGATFFDLGVPIIDKAYQPPYHVRPGFQHAWRDSGTRRTTDAGKLRTAIGLRPRTHTYTLGLPFAEALSRGAELARRYGSSEPVLTIYDPDDLTHRQELMLYGAMRVEDADLVDEAPDLLAKRIVIDEIL